MREKKIEREMFLATKREEGGIMTEGRNEEGEREMIIIKMCEEIEGREPMTGERKRESE